MLAPAGTGKLPVTCAVTDSNRQQQQLLEDTRIRVLRHNWRGPYGTLLSSRNAFVAEANKRMLRTCSASLLLYMRHSSI